MGAALVHLDGCWPLLLLPKIKASLRLFFSHLSLTSRETKVLIPILWVMFDISLFKTTMFALLLFGSYRDLRLVEVTNGFFDGDWVLIEILGDVLDILKVSWGIWSIGLRWFQVLRDNCLAGYFRLWHKLLRWNFSFRKEMLVIQVMYNAGLLNFIFIKHILNLHRIFRLYAL